MPKDTTALESLEVEAFSVHPENIVSRGHGAALALVGSAGVIVKLQATPNTLCVVQSFNFTRDG